VKNFITLLFVILNAVCIDLNAQFSLFGIVKDQVTNEPLIGVNLKVNNSKGTVTDFNGAYKLSLSSGSHKIMVSYIGYESKMIEVDISNNSEKDIFLTEESSELDVVVVSASKFEQKLEEVTVSVDVIGAKLIDSKNCVTLSDVIRNAPGVQLIDGQLNIRAGSGWSYGTGSRVLVMIDDMPVIAADRGDVDFNLIPMENIEQMEIIKGASSALYGSSALNGVVNIKTKMPSMEPKTTLRSFVGFWDNPADLRNKWWGDTTRLRSGLSLTHSRKIKNFNMVLSASHYNDRGYIQTVNNIQTRIAANTKLVYDNVTFGLNANYMQRESGLFTMWSSDTSAYIPLGGTDVPNSGSRFYIDPSVTFYNNFFKHTLRSRILRRNVLYTNNNTYITSMLSFNEYQNQYQTDQTTITSGLTLTTLMGRTKSYGGQLNGLNMSGYAQLDHSFGKLNLSTGARYEYFDLDTIKVGKPVFRGGLNYELAKGLNIRSSFGQGFRFPTITELFMEGDIGPVNLYRNPNLRPESGWTAEIGLKKTLKIKDFKGYIDLVGFVMEYNDMMEFTMGIWGPASENLYGLGFSSKNVGKTRIPGVELTINGAGKVTDNVDIRILSGITYSYPYSVFPNNPYEYVNLQFNTFQDSVFQNSLANIVLNGNNDSTYTFVNTSSDSTGLLKYRNHFTMRLDFELIFKEKFTFGFSHQYSSRMANIDYAFVSDVFNTPPSPYLQTVDLGINRTLDQLNTGYHLFDIRLKYNVNETFTLGFLCENVFNSSYLIRPAYMGSPRTFMFQLKKEF